jgi:23S rRNA A1618 N6-methylase RlmF
LPDSANAQLPPKSAQIITQFGQNLLRFVHLIHQDVRFADEPLLKSCVGLIGDLCTVPGMAQEMSSNAETKAWLTDFVRKHATIDQRTSAYAQQRLQAIGVS